MQSTQGSTATPWASKYRVYYGQFDPRWIKANVFWPVLPPTLENCNAFYTQLLESVRSRGFENPILVTDRPPVCIKWVPYGRSRFWCAQQLGIKVPAFVCAFSAVRRDEWWYDGWEEIVSVDQALEKFTDKPYYLEFGFNDFRFGGCAQTHLNAGEREQHEKWQWGRDKRRQEWIGDGRHQGYSPWAK